MLIFHWVGFLMILEVLCLKISVSDIEVQSHKDTGLSISVVESKKVMKCYRSELGDLYLCVS